jgi:hypothetical protein
MSGHRASDEFFCPYEAGSRVALGFERLTRVLELPRSLEDLE